MATIPPEESVQQQENLVSMIKLLFFLAQRIESQLAAGVKYSPIC